MSDIKKIVHNFWYQKVIFWYQKFNHFLISEINFWYQKIIFWYQKISIKVLFGVPCDSNVCTWSQGSHYAKRISSYNQCENHVLGWTWTLELFFHSGGKIFLQRERSMISLVNKFYNCVPGSLWLLMIPHMCFARASACTIFLGQSQTCPNSKVLQCNATHPKPRVYWLHQNMLNMDAVGG